MMNGKFHKYNILRKRRNYRNRKAQIKQKNKATQKSIIAGLKIHKIDFESLMVELKEETLILGDDNENMKELLFDFRVKKKALDEKGTYAEELEKAKLQLCEDKRKETLVLMEKAYKAFRFINDECRKTWPHKYGRLPQ